jgi:hypothetical protein
MSIRSHVARALCVVAAGVASLPRATFAVEEGAHAVSSPAAVGRPVVEGGGLLVDRLSKGDLRLWQSIEEVVAAKDGAGIPRSPTLRRLWEWAGASSHAIHIQMVAPSKLARGMAGVFRVESFDPAGLRHVATVSLCLSNIQRARPSSGPNSTLSFVRFEGLTDAERYAEVLAHELAHAEYFLESKERLAELQAAQEAVFGAFLRRPGPSSKAGHDERARQYAKPLAVLASCEPHAESVEAAVLRELAASARIPSR